MQSYASTAHTSATDPESTGDLAMGSLAGPWRIERELGRGGMGTVYAVVHDEIGKRAALKIMHRHYPVERILLEAKVVNEVGHPNIIDIFETGALPDHRPYIVMERLDGVTLAHAAQECRLQPDRITAILLQICDALLAAHAAGIVHRDLKLDNVFLIDNPAEPDAPRVKLLDWGIAKMIRQGPGRTPGTTIEGQLVGTPQYLAPEQARGGEVTTATDIYSFGVMAYRLYLEQLPFEAETSAEVMVMHLHATPPRPVELWPDIPPELQALLLAMLAKDPSARPSTLAVTHALERIADELAHRRDAISDLPTEPPVCRRWLSAPGLDEPVIRWRDAPRRWPFALGAVALAASAMLYSFARDGAPTMPLAVAAAAPTATRPPIAVPAAKPAAPVVRPAAPPIAKPATAVAKITAPPRVVHPEIQLAHTASRGAPTPRPTPPRPMPPRSTANAPRPLAALVVPHQPMADHPAAAAARKAVLDADGTIDPYR